MGARLIGHALIAATAVAPGPHLPYPDSASGSLLPPGPIHTIATPFQSQPLQGVSSAVPLKDSSFLVLVDNGYGSMTNSADFELRLYRLRPNVRTRTGGTGQVEVEAVIALQDPDHHLPFPLVHEFTADRRLTGADLDPESLVLATDGTLWLGDEFGPYLLHVGFDGRILEPPLILPDNQAHKPLQPGLISPQNPMLEENAPLKLANGLYAHALEHTPGKRAGLPPRPVVSPAHELIKDGNPNIHFAAREKSLPILPPPASREIFDIQQLQAAGYSVIPWTVNEPTRMRELMALGVNGLISDRPDLLMKEVLSFDGNQDGKADFVDAQGHLDPRRFDAQGHRGARGLRPENTLPAFEAALDLQVSTLELDTGVAQDGVPMVGHDPYYTPEKCQIALPKHSFGQALSNRLRRAPEVKGAVLIKSYSSAWLQAHVVCNRLIRPEQQNDASLSPVARAFAAEFGLPDLYTPPTLKQVLEFSHFYQRFYAEGPGKSQPDASARAHAAAHVRFNVETKRHPRTERDAFHQRFVDRTVDAATFARDLGKVVVDADMATRVDIQSFDFNTLLALHQSHPGIRTVLLFGDYPVIPFVAGADGANLFPGKGEPRGRSPWLGGAPWPYRQTLKTKTPHVQPSGGLEAMGLAADGHTLFMLLEKPRMAGGAQPGANAQITPAQSNAQSGAQAARSGTDSHSSPTGSTSTLPASAAVVASAGPTASATSAPLTYLELHRFDLNTRRFADPWLYPLSPEAVSAPELAVLDANRLLVVERDNTEGKLDGFKRIFEVDLRKSETVEISPGQSVTRLSKKPFLDLMRLDDPDLLAPAQPGDIGVGLQSDGTRAPVYAFPYITPETLVPLGPNRLLLINDNNLPFSLGRHLGTQAADDTEWVELEITP